MNVFAASVLSLMIACRETPKDNDTDSQSSEETGDTGESVVDCPITMSLLSGESYTPSVVRLYFTLRDCDGNGVVGQTGEAFSVLEDGSEISIFESEQQIIPSSLGYDIKSLLLLDMSGSIVDSGNLGSLQSAATSFVQSLTEQEVAIYAFDGRQEIQEIVGFTDDTNALQAGIASLSTYEIVDNSTNLNGSVIKGLEVLSQAETQSASTLFSGSLTVFTDGSDQAGWNSNSEATAAVSSSDYSVYSIGLGGEVDESHLSSLGSDGSWTASNVNELESVFGELSSQIVNRANSLYILAYCSPKRNGEHSLELRLTEEDTSLFYTFDATGFEGGCSPDDFLQESTPVLVEDCTDGVDNDSDGLSDCDDSDCEDTPDCESSDIGIENNPGLSCKDILDQGGSNGDGNYWIDPDGSGSFEVYCDMTTDGGGWILIQSYDISYKDDYWRKPLLIENFPRNENNHNWDDYRLDLSQISSIYDLSTHFHARCHRLYADSSNDYIFGKKELISDSVQRLNTESANDNPYEIDGKIRGYSSGEYNFLWWNIGPLNQSPHIDSEESGIPGHTSSEDNFNWENNSVNPDHQCHSSDGEIIWMLR